MSNRSENIIDKYVEHGICYPNMTLNIRSMPCATTGEVLDQYYVGESVIYDYVVITDKYVWISWISGGSSRRVYMAVKDKVTGERFALCDDIPIGSGGNQGSEIISNEYAEDGICYPNRTINIRNIPCSTTGIILDQYYEGENVIYDYVIITDRYVWISWISSGGRRVYMAIKDQSTGERFATCTDIPGGGPGASEGEEVRVKEYPETGICYPNMTLNIRSIPCATTGEILDQYYEGESVVYDYVIITNKYVWISWTSAGSGRRVYMAVKDQITEERFALCTDIPGSESGGSNGSGGGAPMPGVRKVFIDPGHGGSDPGASGNGLKEKEVVLEIAKKLGRLLSNNGIEVNYSREDDIYVDLSERARQANEWGADLFVSIHTNAFDGSAYGTECYTHPNDTAATKQLSRNVANTLSSRLNIYNRGHKEADFAVLRLSSMPAILIETAFIDNSSEANLLKNKRDDIAKAIYIAITGATIENGNQSVDYSNLFKGELFQKVLDNSWLFDEMSLEFTSESEKLNARSNKIITSMDPIISVQGEISLSPKILGGSTYTFGYDIDESELSVSIMSKYIGSDVDLNFGAEELRELFKVAGVAIPVGSILTIKSEITGINSMEIIAEHQVDTSFLPEEYQDANLYIRLKINISKIGFFRPLYVPARSYEESVSVNPDAGVNWDKLLTVGATIVVGVAVAGALATAIIILANAISAIGATAGAIVATQASVGSIVCMLPRR